MPNKIILAATYGKLSKVRDALAIEGTINNLYCQFEFRTNDYDDTTKTAIFVRGRATPTTPNSDITYVMLDDNNECEVPSEILSDVGCFSVGVVAMSDEKRIVSNWMYYKIADGCYADGSTPIDPTSTVYEQILSMIATKSDIGHNHNTTYYTKEEIAQQMDGKSNVGHNHDGIYYQKMEIDSKLETKSDIGHDHNDVYYTKDEVGDIANTKMNKFAIQKIQDYLYYIDYDDIDYANGIQFCLTRFNPAPSACSAVRKGNFYGRNYDWYYDENATFIINRKAIKGKFASIGVAAGLITNDLATSGEYNELYEYLPFITLDGINENGVVCNINVLPELDAKGHTTGTNPGKQDVPMACLVRCILDDASSADDAIYKIQHDYNIIAPNSERVSSEMHFMIADSQKTYVVEFVNNAPIVVDTFVDNKPIMTNFYLTGYNGTRTSLTPYAMGIERYSILSDGLDTVNTVKDMADLMKSVFYTKAYSVDEDPVWYSEFAGQYQTFGNLTKDSTPEEYAPLMTYVRNMFAIRQRDSSTWQTVHSSVYDIKNKMLHIIPQEGENYYEFNLAVLGEQSEKIKKIGYGLKIVDGVISLDMDTINNIIIMDAGNILERM